MLAQTAQQYATRGWLVIPLHITTQKVCSCGKSTCKSPGKHPRTRNGLKDASRDPDQILSWFGDERRLQGQFSGANIGIVTGSVSNLFVVDLDGEEAHTAFMALVSRSAITISPEQVMTGRVVDDVRTGRHLYYSIPEGQACPPNSQGALAPGVDIRGEGGYVVAPPSLHASGRLYRWAEGDEVLAHG